MIKEDYDFQGQLKYEHFQFFFRRHWMHFLKPFFSFIPFGILIFILFFVAGSFVSTINLYFLNVFYVFIAMIVSFFYINAFFLQVIHHYFNLVIVTDCRIVIVRKSTFLKNDSDAIDLTKIQDISVHLHGIFSNYLHYGNLIITLSTSAPPVIIHYVPNPHFYLESSNRIKREYILNRRNKDKNSKNDLKDDSNLENLNDDVCYLEDIDLL
jgi:hypothetical protein